MCFDDEVRLCSCDAEALSEEEIGWILRVRDGALEPCRAKGKLAAPPPLSADDVMSKDHVLRELNARNVFDFELEDGRMYWVAVRVPGARAEWMNFVRAEGGTWRFQQRVHPLACPWEPQMVRTGQGIVGVEAEVGGGVARADSSGSERRYGRRARRRRGGCAARPRARGARHGGARPPPPPSRSSRFRWMKCTRSPQAGRVGGGRIYRGTAGERTGAPRAWDRKYLAPRRGRAHTAAGLLGQAWAGAPPGRAGARALEEPLGRCSSRAACSPPINCAMSAASAASPGLGAGFGRFGAHAAAEAAPRARPRVAEARAPVRARRLRARLGLPRRGTVAGRRRRLGRRRRAASRGDGAAPAGAALRPSGRRSSAGAASASWERDDARELARAAVAAAGALSYVMTGGAARPRPACSQSASRTGISPNPIESHTTLARAT